MGEWKHIGDNGKLLILEGPSDGMYRQTIYLDYDDVNHDEIDRRLPLIIEALNGCNFEEPTDV